MSGTFLARLGVPDRCISDKRTAEEHSRSLHINVKKDWLVERAQVDGCWICGTEQKRVDFLFHVATRSQAGDQRAVLVELKGGHIGHALEQVDSTLSYLSRISHWSRAPGLKKFAFIVVSNGRNIPSYANKKLKIQKQYEVNISIKEHVVIKAGDIDL